MILLIKENTKVDFFYFIQSGKIDLVSNRNNIERHLLINIIYVILKRWNIKYKMNPINDKYRIDNNR